MEKTIAKRKFIGKLPGGGRVVAIGKLYQLQGNDRPYFSLTTGNGCDHKSILAAMPFLKPLVDLHLADDRGWPMHAVANAIYFTENNDSTALARHLRMPLELAAATIGETYQLASLRKPTAREVAEARDEVYTEALADALCEGRRQSSQISIRRLLKGGYEALTVKSLAKIIAMPNSSLETLISRCVEKARVKTPTIESVRREIEKSIFQGIVIKNVEMYSKRWASEAREGLELLSCDIAGGRVGSNCYTSRDLDDIGDKWIEVDSERIEVVDSHKGYLSRVDCGGEEFYLAPNSETAGQAARQYWEDLAKDDPAEFACMVGTETLTSWALGQPAGPGSTKVKSLSDWLDLHISSPEEQFASYDGEERQATISRKLAESLDWDIDEGQETISCVAYRC